MHPSQVSVRRYLPQILGRHGRLKRETKLALLLSAVLLISLDVDSTFAWSEVAQAGSVTSATDVAGNEMPNRAVYLRRSLKRRNTEVESWW